MSNCTSYLNNRRKSWWFNSTCNTPCQHCMQVQCRAHSTIGVYASCAVHTPSTQLKVGEIDSTGTVLPRGSSHLLIRRRPTPDAGEPHQINVLQTKSFNRLGFTQKSLDTAEMFERRTRQSQIFLSKAAPAGGLSSFSERWYPQPRLTTVHKTHVSNRSSETTKTFACLTQISVTYLL